MCTYALISLVSYRTLWLQSISSTESSFDTQKMSQYRRTNESFGLSGITDESDDDDDDDDDLPVGQYLQTLFSVSLMHCQFCVM